jgi:hypothetical protein
VVPLPAYGSHTSSPGSEKSVTSSRRSPSGFCAGWHRAWSAVEQAHANRWKWRFPRSSSAMESGECHRGSCSGGPGHAARKFLPGHRCPPARSGRGRQGAPQAPSGRACP